MICRQSVKERPDWRKKNAAIGFDFDVVDGVPYWNEGTCYELSLPEVETLEAATAELHERCLELVERVVRERWFARLQIPQWLGEVIIRSWERDDPSVYGRFDLAYDGAGAPKLLEYNADTPTSLLESSMVQWEWLQELSPNLKGRDQFNSIHERLIAAWKRIGERQNDSAKRIHFGYLDYSLEDYRNVEYLMDTAAQAGFDVHAISMDSIGSDGKHFYDLEMRKITTLFKLYPYEWMQHEKFGQTLTQDPCLLLEPPWKLILSNKTTLALLWELFPDHPNLLPSFIENPQSPLPASTWPNGVVRKPLYGREGSNVSIRSEKVEASTEGPYGYEGFLLQAYTPLLQREGNQAIFGSWVIGDEPAGICVREDRGPIMSNVSRICPHYFG